MVGSQSYPGRHKVLSALKWNYLGTLAKILVQLGSQVVLARILGPESFGTLTFCILAASFAYLVAEFGLGSALIQASSVSKNDIEAVFTRLAIAGGACILLFSVAGSLLAEIVGHREIGPYLRFCGVGVALQLMAATSLALLRRQLDFRSLQLAQLAGHVAAYWGIGLVLASAGMGQWSLVVAWNFQQLVILLFVYWKVRHPLKFRTHSENHEHLIGFGKQVTFTNLANWAIEGMDRLLVGRAFGVSALGAYSVAFNLVRTPANHLVATLQSVMFPASAANQENLVAIRKSYISATAAVVTVAFPIFVGIAAAAEPLVDLLYGAEWKMASEMLTPLAIAMCAHALMAVAGPVLWGRGRVRIELRVQLVVLAVLLPALAWASTKQAPTVAWSLLFVYLLRAVLLSGCAIRELEVSIREFCGALRGGVMFGTITWFTVWVMLQAGRQLGIADTLVMSCAPLVSFLFCGIVALWVPLAVFPRAIRIGIADVMTGSTWPAVNWIQLRLLAGISREDN